MLAGSRSSAVLFSVVLAAAAFAVIAAGTRHGIGLTTDSSVYLGAARSLIRGHGVSLYGEPVTHFPPLYPALLSAVGRLTGDPLSGARWLQALLFAANVALVTLCTYTLAGRRIGAGVVAGLLMLVCRSTLRVHLNAWSEPLFLLLSLGSFSLLAMHLRRPRTSRFLGAAAAMAAALLTRFAGLALLPPAAVAILVLGRGSRGRRAVEALILVSAASAPLLAWLWRGAALTGSATNRSLALHPIGWPQIEDALSTLSFWVWPFQMGSLLGVAVLVAVFGWALRLHLGRREPPPFATLAWLFFVSYPVFLVLSVSFVDAATPLQERVLSPLYPLGAIVVVAALWNAFPRESRWPAVLAVAIGLSLVVAHADRGWDLWRVAYTDGFGYSDPRWQDSEVLGRTRALPATTLVYSNAPDVISVLLDRDTRWIPERFDPVSQAPNPALAKDLATMRADLEGGAKVVLFELFAWRKRLLARPELERETGVIVLETLRDGVILGLPAPAPLPAP